MKSLLQQVHKFFDIRDGEESISLMMQLYIFLIICALLIVKPTVSALFLSQLGAENLSVAFIIIAITAVVVSFIYNKYLEKFALRYIIRSTLILFSVGFIAMGCIVALGWVTPFFSYLFYTMVGMFALLATSQFWVLANVVFNVREAKRLFGFIGAGGIAGGIIGGYLTSILAGYLGNGVLMILSGVLIAACKIVFNRIWKTRVQTLSKFKRKERATVSTESSIKLIYKSKHLTYLAAVIGLGVLVAKLVDYQFSYIAAAKIPDPQELASFFGFWFSTFNIVSLLIQLFVTNKILENTDISVSLIALPIGIVLLCLALLVFPELWIVIIIKGLDGSLKQSLHKSAVELLALPIPSSIKNKTKTFIDVVVDSLATGIAGFLLIFVIKGLELSATYITLITILIVLVWIIVVFKVRDAYLGTFKESIMMRENMGSTKKSIGRIRQNMRVIFESGSEKDILEIIKRLPEITHPSLKNDVLKLLNHESHKVKAAVVDSLRYITKEPQTKVQDFIYIKDDTLIMATMRYLMSQDKISYQFFEQYLDYENEFIATAALLALARESEDNPTLAAKYNLHLRIKMFIDELESEDSDLKISEIARLIETLGYVKRTKYHDIIETYLKHPNPILKNAAILAAGETAREKFLPVLYSELENIAYRESSIKAISSFGNAIIPTLYKKYLNANLNSQQKSQIPTIISNIHTEKAYRALFKMSQRGDFKLRTKVADLLYTWRKEGIDYSINQRTLRLIIANESKLYRQLLGCYFSIRIIERSKLQPLKVISLPEKTERSHLIQQLKTSLELNLKRVFNLLALYYNPEDVFVAYRGLKSETKESQLHAMEYLEGLLSRNLKTLLLPILESGTSSPNQEMSDYHKHVSLLNQEDCLKTIMYLEDESLQIKAIALLKIIEDDYSYKLLIDASDLASNKITEAALEALKFKNGKQRSA
ncbi:Npt1/Npt2 family nucleotide transporter [uncultured Nonlabens sp.]|uniref:Npt1/Npt2 family nucleotide transporter n=1 Tax=uncultured Nonlabens sp. TaxID=859306 RepID=UPI0026362E6D|nr:Npt1/Npt2 family nucleotide transporter [uncultured Nonlabens sp.]